MILVGNQRGNGRDLARHLMKDENERVILHELRGFVADTLDGAFQESLAISRATKCQQHLFSMSFNPPKGATIDEAGFERAIDQAEERLGLAGQPRAVVFHEKRGGDGEVRRHAHAVWCRIDPEKMRAIPLPHSRQKMQTLARELYIEHGWEMPRGFVNRDFTNPRNYSLAEWQQAKRARRDPDQLKGMFQDSWATTDSQVSLAHAMRERGFVLARGDRRAVVAVDHDGEVYALTRWIGIKTKQVRARITDEERLPDVPTAHRQAASVVKDRLRELHRDVGHEAKSELAAVAVLKRTVMEAHAKAAQDLQLKQKTRATQAEEDRASRFRRGWRGLLDRLTGRHGKTERQNQHEREAAERVDVAEQARLHREQRNAAQRFNMEATTIRARARHQFDELREDFRRIAERANAPPEPTIKQSRRRRRRNRDGPT